MELSSNSDCKVHLTKVGELKEVKLFCVALNLDSAKQYILHDQTIQHNTIQNPLFKHDNGLSIVVLVGSSAI